jgi:serine/threonine protein kinase
MGTRDTATHRTVAHRYELREIIGRGGVGIVWRSFDRVLERTVAVKEVVLPPALTRDEDDVARARVLREARAAAALNHPGILTIFDVLEEDGRVFIVMELMDGPSLEDRVRAEGPLSAPEAARVALALVEVMNEAHGRGIIHRDVKPANVMVGRDGAVKLADFGIASVQEDPKLTTTGLVVGSPAYMAPEQARGHATEPATDLWGLGATLYFAVEGRPPFERGAAIPTLSAVVNEDPAPMSRARSLMPVILALLAKRPEDRPTGSDLAGRLRAEAEEGEGPPVSTTEMAPIDESQAVAPQEVSAATRVSPHRTARQVRWAAAVPIMAAGLLLVVLIGAFALFADRRDQPEQANAPSRSPSQRASPEASPSPTDDTSPSPSPRTSASPRPSPSPDQAVLPQGWIFHRDPATGYRAAHPEGWQVVRREQSITDIVDPETGAYFRIQWTPADGTPPQQKWEEFSQDFASRHRNYREIGITPTTFLGLEASEWEFTYTEGGVDLHATDLGFETEELDFALFFQSRAEDWGGFPNTREVFRQTFEL